MKALWTETYRPNKISDYVFRDENQRKQVQAWIADGALPHLLFSGAAGTGKTTLARMLFAELDVDDNDIMMINASNENNVDTIRNKITNFAGTMPWGEFKYVLLDECLEENTLVMVLRGDLEVPVKIRDLNPDTDLVKSYNTDLERIEWKTFDLFDKGIQDTLEIELETGDVVICTSDHKWYVEDDGGQPLVVKASELENYGHILSPIGK